MGMAKAVDFLNQIVHVKIDRPLGTPHPKHGFIYPVNYGYVPGTISGDGEELDAYVLGVDVAVAEFTGRCVAVVHRTNDDDDKLIIVPDGNHPTDADIEQSVSFQEQWFTHELIR